MIFCDTSTLAKYYIAEEGSGEVRRHLDRADQVVLSELARIELIASFHQRLRAKVWSQQDFVNTIQQFTHDDRNGFWIWLPLKENILEQATKTFITLSQDIFLRASDCLHLMTAIQHHFSEIYTYDRHQSQAAAAFGMVPVALKPKNVNGA